jgi:Ser/Thr protein kinase RdoA (MazF antagonist)
VTDFANLSHEDQLACLLELAKKSAGNYDLPASVSVEMINLSENATYKVEAPDGRRWALRIHRDGYHSKTAIASELAWLMDLRDTGVVVTPRPVKGEDGGDDRTACFFEEGDEVRK